MVVVRVIASSKSLSRILVYMMIICTLFLTSYIHLQLLTNLVKSSIFIRTLVPFSTRYCSPIRFQFAKESLTLSTNEGIIFYKNIASLCQTTFTLDGGVFNIQDIMQLTIVDRKVGREFRET